MAFEEVCPERIDLIHKNYRKLCNLLIDVEEWGQVVIVNMLTRYARTQFISPWREVPLLNSNTMIIAFTFYTATCVIMVVRFTVCIAPLVCVHYITDSCKSKI